MGMYDTIYFDPPIQVDGKDYGEWQTKDLYNCLYRLMVRNRRLHYIDSKQVEHPLPFTGAFEIHEWDRERNVMVQRWLRFEEGDLKVIEPFDNQYGAGLCHIPAMDEDAAVESENFERSMASLLGIARNRPWSVKVKVKLRRFRDDLGRALTSLGLAFKRLFQ